MTQPPVARDSSSSIAWIVAALIGGAYIACLARLTGFPMQDYANHVARADVMADLLFHHGARFGQTFHLRLMPVPYLLPDLLLTGAVEVFGVAFGAGLFTSLVLLSLPCALLYYARCSEIAPRARPFLFLLGLYLSIDWFFIAGFMAFRLALALIVVSLALAEVLRRRWSAPAFIAYLVVLGAGYLTHLTAPIFMAAALGTQALVRLWLRSTTLRRELILLAPLLVLLGAYFGSTPHSQANSGGFMKDWAGPGGRHPWVNKIRNVEFVFMGFDRRVEAPTMILFAACLFWPIRRELRRVASARTPAVVELLGIAAAFLGIYIVLPFEDQTTLYVDIRALPLIPIVLMLACVRLPAAQSTGCAFGNPRILGLAALLAVAELAYVVPPLASNNAWINRYRAVLSAIPAGAYVLPVHTETERQYLVSVAAHVVLDRGAIDPYLFSGNFDDPMTYFRYAQQKYAPDYHWYRMQLHDPTQSSESGVDWTQVACDYRFLLVTMPYDANLIRVPTMKIASNEAATLLAVGEGACPAGRRQP